MRSFGKPRPLRRSIALAKDELTTIARYAKLHGLTVSAYMRMRATADPIERVS